MKHLTLLTLLLFSFTIYAHKQHVHQYLTSEVYKLVKNYVGNDFSQMSNHIDNGLVGLTWENGTLTAGAWLEDEDDIVYGYYQLVPADTGSLISISQQLLSASTNWETQNFVTGKIPSSAIMSRRVQGKVNSPFTKIHDNISILNLGQVNFYPLNNNDLWEYIVNDTTTFMGVSELKYSVIKEIIGDTLMTNGISYKIIKWEKCANSVSELPYYEFQRKDGNKIYIYYSGKDYLLYDFSLSIGSTYQSHYPGLNWTVTNKYAVTGFNDTLAAVDLQLIDQNSNVKRNETVVENFGLTFYMGDVNISPYLPKGSFFGGIISDSTFGYLLAKRQKIYWDEFYPLHDGDFWKYKGNEGVFDITRFVKVIKDTLMSDSNIYRMLESKKIGGPYPSENLYYERIDSNGIVTYWNAADSCAVVKHIFSACLGDTSSEGTPNPSYSTYRINDKSFDEIYIYMYPDLIFISYDFIKGLGLYQQTIEGGIETLVGAVINGKATGDTTITSIYERKNNIPSVITLFQNYPNPFNPATIITYTLKQKDHVTLIVYDVLGKEVSRLVDGLQTEGEHSVNFDGSSLASGIYVYQLKGTGFVLNKKMLLLK